MTSTMYMFVMDAVKSKGDSNEGANMMKEYKIRLTKQNIRDIADMFVIDISDTGKLYFESKKDKMLHDRFMELLDAKN